MAMNNETMMLLERHFDAAFAAPDGIKKLRELILTLAMQGKLVPQDPNDQPASELVKKLRQIRRDMYENSCDNNQEAKTMLRKLGSLGDVTSPFQLPSTWTTIHLIDCCEYLVDCHNKTATYKDSGIPIVRTTNIRDRQIQNKGMKYVDEDTYEFWARRCPPQPGDIIFTREAPMGEAAIIPEGMTCCLGQRTMLIRPMKEFICNKYLLFTLTEKSLLERASSSAIGSTVKHLRVGDVEELCIPLPPLAEQGRIVAEIDRLMARCDELEKLRADRSQKLITVHTAALDALLKAKDSSDFSTAWSFVTQNFSELYSVKENVAELRKAILQLAVMGKLVPQDPNDEPASELLKSIEAEKEMMVKEGIIKQPKPLPEIKLEEAPYLLPNSWIWVRLGEIVSLLGDGLHGTPVYDESGEYFFINGNNLSDGLIEIKSNTSKVSVEEYHKYKKELNSRTVLVSINGTIGNVAFYNNRPPAKVSASHLFR
jgi:type I restriction enzyme, S subunit